MRPPKRRAALHRRYTRAPDRASRRISSIPLGRCELSQSTARELAAVTALLDAADRDTGVRRAEAVDEDAARFQPPGDAFRARGVGGAQMAAQTIVAGVGQFDGMLDVVGDRDRDDRPEVLLLEPSHTRRNISNHGRFVEITGAINLLWIDNRPAGGAPKAATRLCIKERRICPSNPAFASGGSRPN